MKSREIEHEQNAETGVRLCGYDIKIETGSYSSAL